MKRVSPAQHEALGKLHHMSARRTARWGRPGGWGRSGGVAYPKGTCRELGVRQDTIDALGARGYLAIDHEYKDGPWLCLSVAGAQALEHADEHLRQTVTADDYQPDVVETNEEWIVLRAAASDDGVAEEHWADLRYLPRARALARGLVAPTGEVPDQRWHLTDAGRDHMVQRHGTGPAVFLRSNPLRVKVAFTLTLTPEQVAAWQEAEGVRDAAAVIEDVREFLLNNTLSGTELWSKVERDL